MDFVRDFGIIKDGEEWFFGVFESLGKVVKFFFYEEIGSFLGKVDVNYGGVGVMGSVEGIVWWLLVIRLCRVVRIV